MKTIYFPQISDGELCIAPENEHTHFSSQYHCVEVLEHEWWEGLTSS